MHHSTGKSTKNDLAPGAGLSHSEERIFRIHNASDFEKVVWETFHYQAEHVPIYRDFLRLLNVPVHSITEIDRIPFLPVSFFKTQRVFADDQKATSLTFLSSTTTGTEPSRHEVARPEVYQRSLLQGFEQVYGDPSQWAILALLPNYLERGNSSLVYMVHHLMQHSEHPDNGFYLHDLEELQKTLLRLEEQEQPTLLIGVSFALLDLAEQFPMQLKHTTVLETGGMKGKRKELTRTELHERLSSGLGVPDIHSEYGMTELLSQAYSTGNERFKTPPWMHMAIHDPRDPLSPVPVGQTGAIHVIDLANRYSCAFLATQDLGRAYPDGSFEVLGRFDASDVRGCNLMIA